jgi:predicted TIM-barrel fold metal-dependent hydrolase
MVLGSAVAGTLAALTSGANGEETPLPIIDSHVHVWDLKQFRLPWLDQFGPDRVLFGGNWPVCLKGTTLRHWVESLRQIVDGRSEADRRKLFCDNAIKAYRLADPGKLPMP